MASPAQLRREALEKLAQAEKNYARAKENIKELQVDLQQNSLRQTALYNACCNATAECREAATIVQEKEQTHRDEVAKLRLAEARELRAKQELEDVLKVQQELRKEEKIANESLCCNEDEAKTLRAAIPGREDELNEAEIALENCRGRAKAAELASNAADHGNNPHERSAERYAESSTPKRARTESATLPLKTWTTGKIFSPLAGNFVRGYPHASNAAYSQSFIVHLDTGNSAQTIISRTAFEFLGLAQSSTHLGHVSIAGVHGQAKSYPLYEIKYTIDAVNLLKPGTTYQRTAKAAVVESDRRPCDEGYYDLLLNAEDCRKWSDKSTDGKRLRIEILDRPPSNLYDKAPLQMECPFSMRPQGQQQSQRQGSNQEELLRQVMASFGGLQQDAFDLSGLSGSRPSASSSCDNPFSRRGPALLVA